MLAIVFLEFFGIFPSLIAVQDGKMLSMTPAPTQFIIAKRGDEIVIGVEAAVGAYPPNNLKAEYLAHQEKWKEDYRKTPESIALFSRVYRLEKATELESQLYYREIDQARILDSSNRGSDATVRAKLEDWQFLMRIAVQDYDFVFLKNLDLGATKWDSLPLAMRRYGTDYYLTLEINLASAVNWVMTLAPPFGASTVQPNISREQLQSLAAFELLPDPAEANTPLVKWRFAPREWSETSEVSEKTHRRMFVFATPIAERTRGYGQSTMQFLAMAPSATANRGPSTELFGALGKAWSASNLEEQKSIHLKRHHDQLDRKDRQRTSTPSKRHPDTYKGVPVLTRGLLDKEARLIATIDCGVGYIHFFWNPPDARLSPGKVVHVVVQEEDGVPKLGDSFSNDEAAVSELFATEEFKVGLIDYMKAKRVDVLKAAGYPID